MKHFKNVFALSFALACLGAHATPNDELYAAAMRLDAAGVTQHLLQQANPNMTFENRPLIAFILEDHIESPARTSVIKALLVGGANPSYGEGGLRGIQTVLTQRDWAIAALFVAQVPSRWDHLVAAQMAIVEAEADMEEDVRALRPPWWRDDGDNEPTFAPGAPPWPQLFGNEAGSGSL